jgi:hypothetical protein
MRILVVLATLGMMVMSGCIAELFVIRTVEELKRSDRHVEHTSPKSPEAVTSCMMSTLYSHKTTDGARPYAEVVTQNYGTINAITLRTGQNLATKMYGGGDELLFLIENLPSTTGETRSAFWVNQNILTSKYLDTLVDVVKVCL